jgi:hypothetical protein
VNEDDMNRWLSELDVALAGNDDTALRAAVIKLSAGVLSSFIRIRDALETLAKSPTPSA